MTGTTAPARPAPLRVWLHAIRPRTLPAATAAVVVGLALLASRHSIAADPAPDPAEVVAAIEKHGRATIRSDGPPGKKLLTFENDYD